MISRLVGDKIYFFSDCHLGSRRHEDMRGVEKRVVAFLDSIKHDAKEIYILGDLLDYWYEYRHVVPKGFVRIFGKLAEITDSGIKVTLITGNHDMWTFGYLSSELGIEVAHKPIVRELFGKRFFLAHGEGLGPVPVMERLMLSAFRSKICQRMFSAVHPRWTVPFAFGWSSKNRGKHPIASPYLGKDKEPLMLFAKDNLAQCKEPIDYYLFGHRHIELRDFVEAEGRKAEVVVLGEWYSACSYAVFDGKTLEMRRF